MHPSLADEIDLWRRAKGGEERAREQVASLAEEIATREMSFCRVPLNDRPDLVQESVRSTLAFLAGANEAPRDLRAFLKFRAWGILSDHMRKRRATPAQVEPEEGLELESGDPGPEHDAKSAQLRDALFDCRKKLVEEQRVVLALRYESHIETEVIASELGVHRNTINVRVFRALQNLRECMGRKGFDVGDLA